MTRTAGNLLAANMHSYNTAVMRLQESQSGAAIGLFDIIVKVESLASPEETLAFMEDIRRMAESRGMAIDLRSGCILVKITDPGGHTAEEVLLLLDDVMRGACNGAVLQTGTGRLLTWQPGAVPCT